MKRTPEEEHARHERIIRLLQQVDPDSVPIPQPRPRKDWLAANIDSVIEYHRQYYAKHKETIKRQKREYRQKIKNKKLKKKERIQ